MPVPSCFPGWAPWHLGLCVLPGCDLRGLPAESFWLQAALFGGGQTQKTFGCPSLKSLALCSSL